MKRNFNLKRIILTALIAVVAVLAVVFVIHLRNKPAKFDGSFAVEFYTLESGMKRVESESEWGLMYGDIIETGEYLVREEVTFLEGEVLMDLLESIESFNLNLEGGFLTSIDFKDYTVELSSAYWAIYIDDSATDVGLLDITLEDLDGSILRFIATPY